MFNVIKRGIIKVSEDIKVIYDNDPAGKEYFGSNSLLPRFARFNCISFCS